MRFECGGVLLHSVAQSGDRLLACFDLLERQLRAGIRDDRHEVREREREKSEHM